MAIKFREKPEYSITDRHAEGGKGDRPDGTLVHGTEYKQPFIEHEGVAPDPPAVGKKDVG